MFVLTPKKDPAPSEESGMVHVLRPAIQEDSFVAGISVKYFDGAAENKIVLENKTGLHHFSLPEFPEYAKFTLLDQYQNHLLEDAPFSLFQKLTENDPTIFTNEERCDLKFFFEGSEMLSKYTFAFSEQKPSGIHYSDRTEQYILQFPEIGQDYMESKENGIWSNHGIRLLHFRLSNMPQLAQRSSCQLVFNQIDTDRLTPAVRFGDDCIREDIPEFPDNEEFPEREYTVRTDTGILGEVLQTCCADRQYAEFRGYFEVAFTFGEQPDGDVQNMTYQFPVRLIVVNTAVQSQDKSYSVLDESTVSIDFGTSSTCVAIDKGKPQLIQLTSVNDSELLDTMKVNLYETPTNLMVYRWEKLYAEWKHENQFPPLVRRHKTGLNELADDAHEFDFGYGVKESLSEADKRYLDAVMTELKLIPSRAVKEEKQSSVNPFHIEKYPLIYLISEPEQEDETHFDPIAFYGYLLSRAVNNPASGKIYTNYALSYPVKFNENVRESIRKSLEYGILRALPESVRKMKDRKGKPLCKVTMKYPEPVAYAGAICDRGPLSLDDQQPKLFSVFDFGGGTLDFSFGMYRPSDPDDDEEQYYDSVLEIFGVDGDENIGGERLIHLLSYWIICQNKEEFLRRNIPFVIPGGEDIPDGCDHLFQREGKATPVAKSNILRLNAAVSRNLLEGIPLMDGTVLNEESVGNPEIQVHLMNQYDQQEELDIHYDLRILYENLHARIQGAVELFVASRENIFGQAHIQEAMEKQGITNLVDMHVFLAGNTSRHPLVRSEMEKFFSPEYISMIGTEEEDEYTRYKLTPKTAVAMGQAILSGSSSCMTILHTDGKEPPYARCVARFRRGDYDWIMEKNETDTSWRQMGIINGSVKVFYSLNADHSDIKTQTLHFSEEDNGSICYIRPYKDTGIEYIAVPKREDPENYAETAESIELP